MFVIVKENLFPRSLMGTTMQDGGTRERRDKNSPSCRHQLNSEIQKTNIKTKGGEDKTNRSRQR